MSSSSRAVLLVNLGTPEAPTVPAVRRYLAEFLWDPRVIDLPAVLRWLLLHLVILPFRPRRSAHAYQQIWTERGSPLMVHSTEQREALSRALPEARVALAMRYGKPSLPDTIAELRREGVRELTVVPLYPQRADATTTTTLERVGELAADLTVRVVQPFHAADGFLDASAQAVAQAVRDSRAEHVVFSYHGLPVRHVARTCRTPCAQQHACGPLTAANADCYRAQCFTTSAAIAARAGLAPDTTTTAFQSRLKGARWISPFTDEVVDALARRGVKRVAVACPSFVADCLETLEEIGQRAAEQFKAAGGESLVLVPALNANPGFIAMLADEVRKVQS
jgi:ferrochelatase